MSFVNDAVLMTLRNLPIVSFRFDFLRIQPKVHKAKFQYCTCLRTLVKTAYFQAADKYLRSDVR